MKARFLVGVAFVVCSAIGASTARAQDELPLRLFTNADFPTGVNFGDTNGVSFGDFDRDGWVDVFAHASGNLWRNLQGKSWVVTHFDEVLLPTDASYRYGASFGDYDNDGYPDIAVEPRPEGCAWLLHNLGAGAKPPYFKRILPADGVFDTYPCDMEAETIGWADVDSNGALDLFIPGYPYDPSHNWFFTNQGPRDPDNVYTFLETTKDTGLYNTADTTRPEGAQFVDIDQDGDIDLYSNGLLYQNVSGLSWAAFVALNTGTSGLTNATGLDEGAAFADYDLDGDDDLYIVYTDLPDCTQIWENRGDGTFRSIDPSTIESACDGLNLGLSVADWDNDGDVDFTTRNVFRRNQLVETGAPHFTVESTSIPDDFRESATPSWADWDHDGDLDCALGDWFGANGGHFYENTTYQSTNSASERRYVRVRALRDSDTFAQGLETEFGASAEIFVHDAPDAFRRRHFVASGGGYLNENEYAMHFALPADPTPGDPAHDLVFDVVVDFPNVRDAGYARVDRFVNPALGNVDLATLENREITVFRSGLVRMRDQSYPPNGTESVVLHEAAGGLAASSNQAVLATPTQADADEWVGLDIDMTAAQTPVHARELVVDGAIAGPIDCNDGKAESGNVVLWDVTDPKAPQRVSMSTISGNVKNHRTFVPADFELHANRKYRWMVAVQSHRATPVAFPVKESAMTITGGLRGAFDACDGAAVVSQPSDAQSMYATFRYGALPRDACDFCGAGESCVGGACKSDSGGGCGCTTAGASNHLLSPALALLSLFGIQSLRAPFRRRRRAARRSTNRP